MVIKNKKYSSSTSLALALAAKITTTAASFVITSNMLTPAAATTTTNNTTTTSLPSGTELSSQPVYQEQEALESQRPINQTHCEVIVSRNGTLALPDDTDTIRITSTKTGIVSMMEGAFAGKEILTTEDGNGSATATVYQLVRFNMENGVGRAIVIAYIHTDSTGRLAPLEDMILTGIDELYPDGSSMLTLREWQSGIPLPSISIGGPPLMNTQQRQMLLLTPMQQQQLRKKEKNNNNKQL